MKSKIVKTITVLLSLILVLVIIEFTNSKNVKADSYGLNNPRKTQEVTAYDCVYFGSYPQSSNGSGGYKTEPIKWRVLSKNGTDLFLMSDKALDVKPYHNAMCDEITWENCYLREWLNNDFYNNAFNQSEKHAIKTTQVKNENNPFFGTNAGNDTFDKVYLLSIQEAKSSKYSFKTDFSVENDVRKCEPTDYAKNKMSQQNEMGTNHIDTSWLLRSPAGKFQVTYIDDCGCGVSHGSWAYDSEYPKESNRNIRPVLHLDSSKYSVNNAGTVSLKDEYFTWDCINFGSYPQSSDGKGGFKNEPIKWRVLSVNGDDAFLMSDKAIDSESYHNIQENITWENCSLRKWLNSDFYNKAFSSSEKLSIKKSNVVNEDNPYSMYDGEGLGGNNTTDNIFLLSLSELSKNDYGFQTNSISSSTRMCKPTDYATKQGCYVLTSAENNSLQYGTTTWWLRSIGYMSNEACYVLYEGYYYLISGEFCRYNGPIMMGIRPVMHIKLSDKKWTKSSSVSTYNNQDSEETSKDDSSSTDKNSVVTVKKTTIKKTIAKKKALKVTWKKVKGASGYKIQYSTSKKFKKAKSTVIKKGSIVTKTIKKLKRKKKYYFRIRAYKKANGKTYWSKWSKTYSKKTK